MNTTKNQLYAFVLGREFKLSLAELCAVFGAENCKFFNENIAIFELEENLNSQKILSLGGTTRIIKILKEITKEQFPTEVIADIEANFEGKIHFALGSYGINFPLLEAGMRMKKTLSEKKFQTRLLNAKNENIHSAVFKREKLAKTHSEYNLISTENPHKWCKNLDLIGKFFLGVTIACQDIDAYSRRDTGKNRDMIVGMMPPKLVQMMINIGNSEKFSAIYDPFCGLGTTLIEGANMGFLQIFGSDISDDMVTNSRASLADFIETEKTWQERIKTAGGTPAKDFSKIFAKIFTLDATKISKAFSDEKIPKNSLIISEGFLGRIMKKHEMTQDSVFSERRAISRLYNDFFAELKKANFEGNIVMSFPFWKVQNLYIYLDDIAEIITKNGFKISNLLPREFDMNTKNGSLLYRRENQNVGREIICITRK